MVERGTTERFVRRCQRCGDVIGVYEPLIVRRPSGDARTSLAAEPELAQADLACFHQTCFDASVEAGEP